MTEAKTDKIRRRALIAIDERTLLGILLSLVKTTSGKATSIVFPWLHNPPEDLEIVNVAYRFETSSFILIVCSESFQEVSPGSETPYLVESYMKFASRIISTEAAGNLVVKALKEKLFINQTYVETIRQALENDTKLEAPVVETEEDTSLDDAPFEDDLEDEEDMGEEL